VYNAYILERYFGIREYKIPSLVSPCALYLGILGRVEKCLEGMAMG